MKEPGHWTLNFRDPRKMDLSVTRKTVGADEAFAYESGVHSGSTSLDTAVKAAQAVLVGSGASLLVLGGIIWTGQGDQLITIHILIGLVLVLSLWTIAAFAARLGVSGRLIAIAVAWSIVAPILGITQEALLEGDWHWTVQVLHLLIGMGVVGWGRFLVVSMRRAS